jgi:hypothetical protein
MAPKLKIVKENKNVDILKTVLKIEINQENENAGILKNGTKG